MPWDVRERRRYEDEVLTAARTGGPPADLFVRYGVGPDLERRLAADPGAFAAHVAAVCTYWRGLQARRRTLRRVLVDLVAAHERLEREGALTHGHFSRVRDETARRALAEWSDIVDGLATSLVDRWSLRAMAGSVGLPEADAERLLRERGVRVVERLPELPVQPPVRTFRSLRDNLRTRGAVFSPEVVFGAGRLAGGFTVVDGFRLADGGVLDDAALDAAVARVQVEPLTEGKAAAENVLGVLRSCPSRAERDAVVLWEVAEDLRARPAEVGEAALARPWVRRGLLEPEAALLAAAVRRRPAGSDRIARAEREVRDLLADDQLRQAQAAAADLPADHGLAAQVRERAARVDELSARADAALRDGRGEEAAQALAAACALAADDGSLVARLGEVPPLPPREVRARVEGRGAVVVWRPGPSLVGRIGYRVLRRVGRGGREVPVGEVSGTEFIDPGLPVGAEVRYTVVAVREGRGVSEPVGTDPVLLAPEVADLAVHAGEQEVSGSWRVPPEAVRVEVVRGEGGPPRGGDGVRVVTDGMGFRDPDVRPDVEYYYRVRAVYLTSGGSACGSEGLVRRVVPGPPPQPVVDLLVVPDGEGGFTASWTPPPRGRVSLRAAPAPPPWPPGTRVPPADLAAHGAPLPCTEPPAPHPPAPVADASPEAVGRGRHTGRPPETATVTPVPTGTPGTGVTPHGHTTAHPPAAAPVTPAPPATGDAPETPRDHNAADTPGATTTPGKPNARGTADIPRAGDVSRVAGSRRKSHAHKAPRNHDVTDTPGATGTPGKPDAPGMADTPGTGDAPGAARTPGKPEAPRAGGTSGAGGVDGRDGAVPGRPERVRVRVEPAAGTHHVVAVTSCGDQAVVGGSVRVVAVPAVAGLHARRFGDLVRLGWTWPEEAAAARVSWRPLGPDPAVDGERLCERPRYEAGGGFEAPMGPGPVRVTVRAVVGGVPGPPAVLTVPGGPVLDYHVAPAGLLRRDRRVTLAARTDCASPRIAVVYAEGGFPPDRADQGRVLAVFPPRRLTAGRRLTLRVRPPRSAGPAWLVCLPLDGPDDADGTRLCQPSVKEIRL